MFKLKDANSKFKQITADIKYFTTKSNNSFTTSIDWLFSCKDNLCIYGANNLGGGQNPSTRMKPIYLFIQTIIYLYKVIKIENLII